MSRFFLFAAGILLLGSCCNKKACPGDELPSIVVKFSGAVQRADTARLYTYNAGNTTSALMHLDQASRSLRFFPMESFEDRALLSRYFVIWYDGKPDTLERFLVDISEVEIECDSRWGCGRGLGNNKTTVNKVTQFSYRCSGKNYGLGDTLYLD